MLAEVEVPLQEVTRKDVLFHWDKTQAAAFQELKNVCCEASKNAVGAVVLQEGRPIAYKSLTLRESELSWAPIENEMLAIVFSTQKFREYVPGKKSCGADRQEAPTDNTSQDYGSSTIKVGSNDPEIEWV